MASATWYGGTLTGEIGSALGSSLGKLREQRPGTRPAGGAPPSKKISATGRRKNGTRVVPAFNPADGAGGGNQPILPMSVRSSRTGSAPIARAITTNSTTSSRRSPPSYFATND